MIRITSHHLAVFLMAASTVACGQDSPPNEVGAESATDTQAVEDSVNLPDEVVSSEGEATTIRMAASGSADPLSANPETVATPVSSLPLRNGYYVRSGTPCEEASRADVLALVTPTGMGLNCTFKRIEQTSATTYRVTSVCTYEGAAWGREDNVETATDSYEIRDDTSFSVTYDGGSEASARHCPQLNS